MLELLKKHLKTAYLLCILFSCQFSASKIENDRNNKLELIHLAEKALQTLDVPIACIITYNTSIVGRGYNRVLADVNVGHHAEIMAISDAKFGLGEKHFNLIKDSLLLITTFEPCLMCRGAIIENGISNVAVIKKKTIREFMRQRKREWQYEVGKTYFSNGRIQDSLFELHPDYINQKSIGN